jgi:hypothetical protein
MSKKEALTFFLSFFVCFWLSQAGAEVLLGDEGLGFADAIQRPPAFIGALVGSVVASGFYSWLKNRQAPAP